MVRRIQGLKQGPDARPAAAGNVGWLHIRTLHLIMASNHTQHFLAASYKIEMDWNEVTKYKDKDLDKVEGQSLGPRATPEIAPEQNGFAV